MTRLGASRRPVVALAVLLCAAVSGCTRATPPRPVAIPASPPPPVALQRTTAAAPGPEGTSIAKVLSPTPAFSVPAGSRVVMTVGTTVRPGGGPMELRVLDRRRVQGTDWLEVLLPIRPNGLTGWIDAAVARLSMTPYRIVVSTKDRTVDVYQGERLVRSVRAVVGALGTPTPHGSFAIAERVPIQDPDGFYGPWILTLTAHSTVLDTFDGGDGLVAIHGRGGTSLSDPLGSARSHGCIRIDNPVIDWLAAIAQPGTPVVIR